MNTGRDICWAISMMRKSGKVHRTAWAAADDLAYLILAGPETILHTNQIESVLWVPSHADLLATDWELAGE